MKSHYVVLFNSKILDISFIMPKMSKYKQRTETLAGGLAILFDPIYTSGLPSVVRPTNSVSATP